MKDWKIAIGQSDFRSLIEDGECYYVDKTMFIKDIIDNKSQVALITRPRRFGKTLNMSMLKYFFSIDEKSEEIFKDLKIMKQSEEYTSLLNSKPVIYLTMNGMYDTNLEMMYESFKWNMQFAYEEHSYLLESDKIIDNEKEKIKDVLSHKEGVVDLQKSILSLALMLKKHYGKKSLLLVDEYDVPIQNAYIEGYYDEAINFFKSFYGSTFKDNQNIEKTVITGVSRVSKEGLFSGANNFDVYTVLSSPEFSDDFGILEDELDLALKAFRLETKKSEVQKWYDGYRIDNTQGICNTWSIINYLQKKELKPYWVNTSSNDLIKKILKENKQTKEQFEELLQGREIEVTIDEETIIVGVENKAENIWGLLLGTGYLKITKQIDTDIYKVKLPNYEIQTLFKNIVEKWFYNKGSSNALKDILNDLTTLNFIDFDWRFKRLVQEMFSYMDVGIDTAENFYHAFVLGMLVGLKDTYYVHSNREAGLGRYDIKLEPKDKTQNAFIMEFKLYSDDKTIEQTLIEAQKQIEKKNYEAELKERGFQNINKIAFAFKGKEVKMLYNNLTIEDIDEEL